MATATGRNDSRTGSSSRSANPFMIDGQEFFLTASVGHRFERARRDRRRRRAPSCSANADLAMYDAKASGRDCSSTFEPEMRNRATERQRLQTDLQHAVARGELRLDYQPIVDLQTCAIIGMEALLRWDHPERGLIMPTDFIPLAEETGVIVPIGRWVFREACRQAAHWQRTIPGHERLAIAINVSGRQLQHPEFAADVEPGDRRRAHRSQARHDRDHRVRVPHRHRHASTISSTRSSDSGSIWPSTTSAPATRR